MSNADIVVVGAGAAGLFAAIHAARGAPHARVVAIDSAKSLGAKILVAGGGRCNVTHREVSEGDYCGSSSPLIRRVLRQYCVAETIAFFAQHGVALKEESTGKLFPTTDKARTVLDALLSAAASSGVTIQNPCRVESIVRPKDDAHSFEVCTASGPLTAKRVIVATGGMSLPKSGSDGSGYALAKALGHSMTPMVVPALVPLTLPDGHWLRTLSGLALDARVQVVPPASQRTKVAEGPVLCTHFGLSGPAILDISRHWIFAHEADSSSTLRVNWLPRFTPESLDEQLLASRGQSLLAAMRGLLPDRFLRELCAQTGVDPSCGVQQIPRTARVAFVRAATTCEVPISGTRGFTAAETTAGGIPLHEVDQATMESLRCPGLHLCGEVLDVDGRIGGFSFQWAWSSAFVAGTAAAAALTARA